MSDESGSAVDGSGSSEFMRGLDIQFGPDALAQASARLGGREFLQAIIDGELPPPPFAQLMNAELISVGDGEAVFSSTARESMLNPLGLVHGGVICGLLDSAAGCAVHTRLPAGSLFSSIEIKVSFLEPVPVGTRLEVRGRALRVGSRVAFAEAHAYGSDGELLGHATTSLAVRQGPAREALAEPNHRPATSVDLWPNPNSSRSS